MMSDLIGRRLRLRPIGASDVDALHSLWTGENVRRYLWDGEVIPPDRTRAIVEQSLSLFDAHGFGIWAVRERGGVPLVGFAGFWHFRDPPQLELLFGVSPGYWGRGFATESGSCVIRHGFETLRFPHIDASTDTGNAASIRVLEKLRMIEQRREIVNGADTIFYRVTRAQWAASESREITFERPDPSR